MKTKKLRNLFLIVALTATFGLFATSCSKHTEVNELISTLNQYADSFNDVTSLDEFNSMMTQFNDATSKYAESTAPVDKADREAILKAIEGFSAAVNKSMSQLLNIPLMTDEQRGIEMEKLSKDIADTKTLGEVIKICMQE